jgi:hypothetical protein
MRPPDAKRSPVAGTEDRSESFATTTPNDTTLDLLDRLEGIRHTRHGLIAFCPAHADTVGALTVEGGLVVCQAGCTLAAVYAAVGLVEP